MTYASRVFFGHRRTFLAAAAAAAAFALLPQTWSLRTRAIGAWDIGAAVLLLLCGWLFIGATPEGMEANAEAQQEGEWTLFWLVVAAATASFAAIVGEFGMMKNAPPVLREFRVGIVVLTLGVSWLLTQVVFALRYAHEFYTRTEGNPKLDGGLDFPKEPHPDYWDFLYFSLVLGMTFQVSDVQITSRKFRRLAAVHGMLGFLFNTVIIALTVNLASGLLS